MKITVIPLVRIFAVKITANRPVPTAWRGCATLEGLNKQEVGQPEVVKITITTKITMFRPTVRREFNEC